MTRIALIPFAIFASACADSADLDQTADDVEAEVRELIESHDGLAERSNPHSSRLGMKVVQVASKRYADKLNEMGCNMVGAGFGKWGGDDNNNHYFTGAMFHNSAQPMARIHGEIEYTGNRTGILMGESHHVTSSKSTLLIDADWKGKTIIGDVYTANGDHSTDLVIFGSMHRKGWADGYFVTALAQCD